MRILSAADPLSTANPKGDDELDSEETGYGNDGA